MVFVALGPTLKVIVVVEPILMVVEVPILMVVVEPTLMVVEVPILLVVVQLILLEVVVVKLAL